MTNSVENDSSAPLWRFWAFLLHYATAFDTNYSIESVRFFAVGIKVWVKQKSYAFNFCAA